MEKALKPLIVILLLLSITSLVFGIMLFQKREILKGRTQKLESAVEEIAGKLRYEGLNKQQIQRYEEMDKALNLVAVAADVQYEELQQKTSDLEIARNDLKQTREELAQAKNQISELDIQVAGLEDRLLQKDEELAQANSRSEELEQDKDTLQVQINDLNDQLVKAEEERRDLQDQMAGAEQTIDALRRELGEVVAMGGPKGLSGSILVVNSDWNFVVLDVGSEDEVPEGAEMLVHRNDRFIGKIRVSNVKESMAVAEILRDWEQMPIQKGDNVLF